MSVKRYSMTSGSVFPHRQCGYEYMDEAYSGKYVTYESYAKLRSKYIKLLKEVKANRKGKK